MYYRAFGTRLSRQSVLISGEQRKKKIKKKNIIPSFPKVVATTFESWPRSGKKPYRNCGLKKLTPDERCTAEFFHPFSSPETFGSDELLV